MKLNISDEAKFVLRFSGAEMKLLRGLLEDSPKALNILNRSVVAVKEPAKVENLTNENLPKFLGKAEKFALVYNFDTSKWNKDMFLGHGIKFQKEDSIVAEQAKKKLNQSLAPEFEVVAFVTMPIKDGLYTDSLYSIKNPNPNAYGLIVVGNILCRDLMTNKIVPVSPVWSVVAEFAKKSDVVNGAGWFAAQMNSNEDVSMRKRVLNNFLLSHSK